MAERAYFTAYIDVYSGEVLTWNIDLHPTVEFVTKPLDELLQNRPESSYRMTIHSDQGFQYQNYDELKSSITNYVYYYNNKRLTGRKNSGSIPKSFRPVSRLNFIPIFEVQFTWL